MQSPGELNTLFTSLQAESWLNQQAQKEGWSKANKLEGRRAKDGLVGVFVGEEAAVMVEVRPVMARPGQTLGSPTRSLKRPLHYPVVLKVSLSLSCAAGEL